MPAITQANVNDIHEKFCEDNKVCGYKVRQLIRNYEWAEHVRLRMSGGPLIMSVLDQGRKSEEIPLSNFMITDRSIVSIKYGEAKKNRGATLKEFKKKWGFYFFCLSFLTSCVNFMVMLSILIAITGFGYAVPLWISWCLVGLVWLAYEAGTNFSMLRDLYGLIIKEE